MTTLSHEPSRIGPSAHRALAQLTGPEMWASLAIIVMWLAVLADAVFGPDIVTDTAGGDHTVVPSAVALALFAFLGTWVVARHGFRRGDRAD
jgi:hypothetical protein